MGAMCGCLRLEQRGRAAVPNPRDRAAERASGKHASSKGEAVDKWHPLVLGLVLGGHQTVLMVPAGTRRYPFDPMPTQRIVAKQLRVKAGQVVTGAYPDPYGPPVPFFMLPAMDPQSQQATALTGAAPLPGEHATGCACPLPTVIPPGPPLISWQGLEDAKRALEGGTPPPPHAAVGELGWEQQH